MLTDWMPERREVGAEKMKRPKEIHFSEAHWKSLLYFSAYRFFLAGLLFVVSLVNPASFQPFSINQVRAITGGYFLAMAIALISARVFRRHFNWQVSLQVLADIAVFITLVHFNGELFGSLGVMLLVTLAGAGLVGQGRLVLFYAAMATLSVLFEQAYRGLVTGFVLGDFFQTGLFCIGFFGVAVTAHLLARRVITNEALARQRGIDLHNQMLVSQRVIEEMQDGILVLKRDGMIWQHNPRACELLGLGDPTGRLLADYSSELSRSFVNWCAMPSDAYVLVRAPASGMRLQARFLATDSLGQDVLVFLEDMERVQTQARQIKLAALGRLTGSIAHEIRNPLSAIQHASELLAETQNDPVSGRLLRIVIENTQRVERIVSDVLAVGRRDRLHRELIDLRQMLPLFVEEYSIKENVAMDTVRHEVTGLGVLCFDRSHFHQVLWNLAGNALRHSHQEACSILLRVKDGVRKGTVEFHVIDDGPGVEESLREQIFEPFFTTHSRGTGLGLYIARELCEANGAQLDLVPSETGADFCIVGRNDECQ